MYSFPIFRSVGSFLSRRKRSIKWILLLATSSYAVYKAYTVYLEYDKTKKTLRAYMYDRTRMPSHLLSARRECLPSILNFLKILHKRVVESVDVVHAVKR